MKKFLLSLIMMAFAGYVSAQSFTFEHNGETVEPGYYEVIGDIDPNTGDMAFAFNIINLTDNSFRIKCDRVILEKSEIGSVSVCMGVDCFASFVDNTYADIEGLLNGATSIELYPVIVEEIINTTYDLVVYVHVVSSAKINEAEASLFADRFEATLTEEKNINYLLVVFVLVWCFLL